MKTIFGLAFMAGCIIMTFTTKDVVHSQLFAALGIISGAFALKFISIQDANKDVTQ